MITIMLKNKKEPKKKKKKKKKQTTKTNNKNNNKKGLLKYFRRAPNLNLSKIKEMKWQMDDFLKS